MADHLGSNLDQPLSERPQRPLLNFLWQCQPPKKIAEVVSKSKQLEPNLISD